MFSSSCSLRSSTCATLIALAAAAGISRFEPAPAKPVASLRALVRVLVAAAKKPQTHSYPISIVASAQAAPVAQMTLAVSGVETLASLAAEAPAAGWSPAPSATETEISFFDWVGAVPTAREHSYPYAVGPPAREIDTPLRVAGNALPGDSSARRSQVSRIAPVFISIFRAPLTRTTGSGPKFAEPPPSPSSALRARRERVAAGPTGFLRHCSRAAAARARRGRIFPGHCRQPSTRIFP